MKAIRVCFTFILFIVIGNVHAQTACLGNSGTLYLNGSGVNYDVGSAVNNPENIYCMRSTGTTCRIYLLGILQVGSGTVVNYSTLPCPIDDYIQYVVVLVGVVGWFKLKNRRLL